MAELIVQQIINENLRAERRFRARENPLETMQDHELYQRYRFTANGLRRIEEMLRDDIVHATKRANALTPMHQILVALRFFASGSFQKVITVIHGLKNLQKYCLC
jgi:hypothetical protein